MVVTLHSHLNGGTALSPKNNFSKFKTPCEYPPIIHIIYLHIIYIYVLYNHLDLEHNSVLYIYIIFLHEFNMHEISEEDYYIYQGNVYFFGFEVQ